MDRFMDQSLTCGRVTVGATSTSVARAAGLHREMVSRDIIL